MKTTITSTHSLETPSFTYGLPDPRFQKEGGCLEDQFKKAQQIKCLICDIDGVLTDGLIHLDGMGNELKSFHIQDGFGLKLLMAADIDVAVITGSRQSLIEHRMKQLTISHYFTGQLNKQNAYNELKARLQLDDEQFAYIGDDLPDLPIIQQVGLGIAVNNAVELVKTHADWVVTKHGGQGAVREVCDFILTAQNKLQHALDRYLNS